NGEALRNEHRSLRQINRVETLLFAMKNARRKTCPEVRDGRRGTISIDGQIRRPTEPTNVYTCRSCDKTTRTCINRRTRIGVAEVACYGRTRFDVNLIWKRHMLVPFLRFFAVAHYFASKCRYRGLNGADAGCSGIPLVERINALGVHSHVRSA